MASPMGHFVGLWTGNSFREGIPEEVSALDWKRIIFSLLGDYSCH